MHNRFGFAHYLLASLLGGLCAFAPSAPAVENGRFIDDSELYDIWMDYLEEIGEDGQLLDSFGSVYDIWNYYREGLEPNTVITSRQNIFGQVSSTNGITLVGGYPVIHSDVYGKPSGLGLWPNAPVFLSIGNGALSDGVTPLVRSVLASIPNDLWVNQIYTNPTHTSYIDVSGEYVATFARWLKETIVTASQIHWNNAPLGVIGAEVLQGPFWYCGPMDLFITPETYYEITGEWPSIMEDKTCVIMEDSPGESEYEKLMRNVQFRVKERWK